MRITNPSPITLRQLQDIYEKLFDIKTEIVTEEEFTVKKMTKAERLFRKANALYLPYLAAEPVFDRTNTDAVLEGSGLEIPVIDYEYFTKLLEYARSVQWGQYKPDEQILSVQSADSIEKYFDDFLAGKMHKQLLPDLRKLTASFRIVIKESPDMYWSLAIERGMLNAISRNGMVCDCSFIVGCDTFADITSARKTPQKAFFDRQVDIEGDIETGLKLVNVLAAFFKRYPFCAEA